VVIGDLLSVSNTVLDAGITVVYAQ